MGTGEGGTPKPSKAGAIAPEPVIAPSYAEWAAAFQAYYGAGVAPPPPGFFPSTVASGAQPNPYMWGGQPLMAPYGTLPPPHAALYPYGGMYPHPSIPPGTLPYGHHGIPIPGVEATSVATTISTDTEVQPPEGKVIKKSSNNSQLLTAKRCEVVNGASESGNGHTQSGESGSEGISEDNEENKLHNDSQRGSNDQLLTANGQDILPYVSQTGNKAQKRCASQTGNKAQKRCAIANPTKVASAPTTNLYIGMMDYWNGPAAAASPGKGKRSPGAGTPSLNPQQVSGPEASTKLWLQDEKELKRQRRKQSNRESARRSRLRKQAECEELSKRVDALTAENMALRSEINRLTEECKKLCAENQALLGQFNGRDKGRAGKEAIAIAATSSNRETQKKNEEAR